MEGLVFTPKRTDFLKDGSIFAQSPASTSGFSKPHLPRSHTGLRPGMEQKAVSDPQVVQAGASLPRAATADSFAQAIWAPQPTRSSRTAAFGQTDMAAQIRSKFENLVRASPLPKVVEQLISPGNMLQQPKWSAGLSSDRLAPPAWQVKQAQQDEDADASQRVAEPVEDVAASQEGPHTSQHTSVTASKMAIQQKRRQPSSSAAIGPASKRQCVVTRSSGGGQVQPLLTAPTDVTFQDKKGLYETSRSGRVRYPPLAFWMRETKVHDKLGGAIAIERPGGNCTPPTHPKPPQPPAHAPTRTQSRPVPTQSQTLTSKALSIKVKVEKGRTALECCNCKFDELPTPVEKVKQTARSAAAKDSSPIRPPALKVAGGRVRKPSAAATKQWARQVRWQQRAQEQSDDDSPQPAAQTTGLHRQRSNLDPAREALDGPELKKLP
ncbi:hypothetical protein WJX79_007784 [Trebouxia sp. C0005]